MHLYLTADFVVYDIRSFVEFPATGLYTMAVQSDDGFRVTLGDRTGPDVGLKILAPANLAGRYFGVPSAIAYGQGFGGALPKTPLVRRAVLCDPPWPTSMPLNASALSNNIALLRRDPSGGVAGHSIWAKNAGAVAVVMVDQDDQGGTGRLPGIWGGAIEGMTIPVVMMDYHLGTNVFAVATTNSNSPVVMSIGDDSSLTLGEFNGGRGADNPTKFDVYVNQAGVYPMRLLFENGGGDASVEWWTEDVQGRAALVNESSPTNGAVALKAYRARSVTTGSAHINPAAISGTNVIVSWTGEGELEQSYSVTGPWFKCPFQNNPATVPINPLVSTASYFRIRQY